jgi:class 3 adenylate cyclase/tetratricopeptide (TPR) repeat protein
MTSCSRSFSPGFGGPWGRGPQSMDSAREARPDSTVSAARIFTILFTDLVGYTELTERLGDERAEQARRAHFALLRDAVEAHGGEEVKSLGDGLMVVFPSAVAALGCATDMQQATYRHNREPRTDPLDVRIGLHVGEPIADEDDYFGTSVNVAKRLCDAAQGGQILVSDLVRALAGGRPGFAFHSVGEVPLRGIVDPMSAYELGWTPAGSTEIPLPSALGASARSPFTGREPEWAALVKHWKEASTGQRHAVFLAGEAGIGKTRLATHLAHRMHSEGAIVLYGRCDQEALIPYQPFVEALRHYVVASAPDDVRDELGEAIVDLARLVPEAETIVAGAPSASATAERADPEVERYRLFRAVGRLFAAASRRAPVLVILDDLHWADPPTLALLKHVLRSPDPSSLLVVGTYRPGDVSRRHPLSEVHMSLRREGLAERIRLDGFTQDEVLMFLAHIAEQELDERGRLLARVLHSETQGNPFFIEEILLYLVETGRLYQDGDVWTSDVTSVDELRIPESVREAIGLRLARLGTESLDVLTQASVLGARVEFPVLVRMADVSEDALVDALDEAIEAQLLVEAPEEGMPAYTFSHALVRQVLYEGISQQRRQRLHLKAADALEAVHTASPPLGALAGHHRAALGTGDPQKAIDFSVAAGAAASRVYAYEDAAVHLRGALELTETHGADPQLRAGLLAGVADLMWITGIDYKLGFGSIEQAAAIYDQLGDDVRAAQMRSRLGRALSTFDTWMDIDRAMDEFHAAERVLSKGPERVSLGHMYIGLATAAVYAMRTEEGLAAADRALEIAEHIGNDNLWGSAAMMRGWHLWSTGRLREGIELLTAAWEAADRLDHPTLGFFTSWTLGFFNEVVLDPRDGQVWCERELGKPRSAEAPTQRGILRLHLAMLQAMGGDASSIRSPQEVEGADAPVAANVWEQFRSFYDGDWDRTVTVTREAHKHRRSVGNRLEVGATGRTLATALRMKGDFDGVIGVLRETLSYAEGQVLGRELIERPEVAVALAATGRKKEARAELDRCHQILQSGEDWRGLPGLVAWAEGVTEGKDEPFTRAVEILHRYQSVWEEAEAYYWWGRIRNDPLKLETAEELYRSINAGAPFIDRVRTARAEQR